MLQAKPSPKSSKVLGPSVDGDRLVVDFSRETPAHPSVTLP